MSCSQVTPIDFSVPCGFALNRVISHISAHLLCYSEKRDSVKPFLPSGKYFADFTWPDFVPENIGFAGQSFSYSGVLGKTLRTYIHGAVAEKFIASPPVRTYALKHQKTRLY